MAPAPKPQKSPACVLVVEDEILIRVLIVDELRAEGFTVVEAATAAEALSYFQAGVQVDLVLSDIGFPAGSMGSISYSVSAL
jgi:CheY-like chemotaxis protein